LKEVKFVIQFFKKNLNTRKIYETTTLCYLLYSTFNSKRTKFIHGRFAKNPEGEKQGIANYKLEDKLENSIEKARLMKTKSYPIAEILEI